MGNKSEHLLSFAAADAEQLRTELQKLTNIEGVRDNFGRGLLHHAAAVGNTESVKLLLAAGCSSNVRDTHSGHTALHEAVYSNSIACVKLLLTAGANPNLANARGETPIFSARTVEVLERLLDAGASSNLKNHLKQTVLRYTALRVVSPEVLKFWLDHGMSVEDVDQQHRTAIHGIFEFGFGDVRNCNNDRMKCLEQLLAAGANVNHQDGSGQAPLHYAAWHSFDRTDFLERLLTAGADPNLCGKAGITPLMMAASKDLVSVVEILLAHGADPNHFDDYHKYAIDRCSRNSQAKQRLKAVTEKVPKPAVRMSEILKRALAIPHYAKQKELLKSAGCSDEEILALEEAIAAPLPASYRLFLSTLGHGLGDFLQCDHITFNYDFVLDSARNDAASFREYAALPEDAVIIMSRMSDWTAFYRSNARANDPAVYSVEPQHEDQLAKPTRVARSISDLFDDLVRDHEQWFRKS